MPGDFVKAGPQRSILDVYQPDGPLQFKLPGDTHNRLELHWNGTIYAGDGTVPPSLITTGSVDSVNGQEGDVQLDAEDIPVTPTGTIAATDVQAAINELDTEKQALSGKNQANGYAGLDSNGLLSTNQLPALAITSVFTVADQAAMLALDAQKGDIAIRSDENKSYALSTNDPTTLSDWKLLLTPTGAVLSVNSQTGAVQLDADDIPVDDSGFSNFEGTDVQAALADIDANWPTGASVLPGTIIARTAYSPSSQSTVVTTSSTFADVDATNLAVTFTVPASGNIRFQVEGHWAIGVSTSLAFGIREGTTDVDTRMFGSVGLDGSIDLVSTAFIDVEGLTPGDSHTYKLSYARKGGSGTAGWRVGGTSDSKAGALTLSIIAL